MIDIGLRTSCLIDRATSCAATLRSIGDTEAAEDLRGAVTMLRAGAPSSLYLPLIARQEARVAAARSAMS